MAQNLTDTIRRKQQRIIELQNEIAALRAELKEARSILNGKAAPLMEQPVVVARKPRSVHGDPSEPRGRTRDIKEGSTVWWARHLLRHWRHDEHIDTIIAEISRATGQEVAKATVVSNLSRYVKKGDTFVRPAESRYGLIDYDEVKAG